MLSIFAFVRNTIAFVTVIVVCVLLYQLYGDRVYQALFSMPIYSLTVNDLTVTATIADTDEERKKGLSGVSSLGAHEVKLFIFDRSDYYGIWMKEMLFPIDIFWLDEAFTIVHIERNVLPSSYPAIYRSDEPARFVLEANAFFADTFHIAEGDVLEIPSELVPKDLR